jgi:hypothetical protein
MMEARIEYRFDCARRHLGLWGCASEVCRKLHIERGVEESRRGELEVTFEFGWSVHKFVYPLQLHFNSLDISTWTTA